ncbi:MAG: SIMPL domain-containing protein [Dehalococcoidia bacterium]
MKPQGRARSLLALIGMSGLLALALGGWVPDRTVDAASGEQTGIAVAGIGSVWVTPDVARLSIGVSSTARTVADARSQAANAMQAVQNALTEQGVEGKDIQTQYFNISPQYSSVPGSQPTITGYVVSNQVQVTVRNIDSVSEVLDTAVAAGGNAVRVNGISFTVDQPARYMDQAREAAVKDALSRATVLARAAGVSVGRPRSIVESGGNVPIPVAPRAAAPSAMDGAPTPVSPGEQQIQVSVSIVYEVS